MSKKANSLFGQRTTRHQLPRQTVLTPGQSNQAIADFDSFHDGLQVFLPKCHRAFQQASLERCGKILDHGGCQFWQLGVWSLGALQQAFGFVPLGLQCRQTIFQGAVGKIGNAVFDGGVQTLNLCFHFAVGAAEGFDAGGSGPLAIRVLIEQGCQHVAHPVGLEHSISQMLHHQ
ncbi:MAG: hypothetical protein P4M00_25710 [Azospirillaceae bacterium]|nr:hypothetical protein [Azospirillaceae bacterium]